ncbi:hypothetical protein ACWA5Z_12515 [Testudinibacter sp. P80/BLE/0925]|uniref:hypothetical protein n=1 Tax=Testudinibacter sp. TW-1 TaxID=3417757 RepID=UPI003D369192
MPKNKDLIHITIIKEIIEKLPINENWKPSDFIKNYWTFYKDNYPNNPSINGTIFEELLVLSLLRENISPIYVQAKLAFVPNVILDIVLYNRKTPITISAKTTLRERWKQADLEAMATKYVHREAKCYVVTLSHNEVFARRNENNSYMGINDFILADTDDYDHLINKLKKLHFSKSEEIKIITTDEKYVDKSTIKSTYNLSFD